MHTSPTPQAYAHWRPLPLQGARLLGGFWGERQAVNRASVQHGHRMLEKSGALDNFRLAGRAARGEGTFQGFVFQDSDAHKWLEALALTLALGPDAELEALADETIVLLASAQQPDGYLNSYFTVAKPGERWMDLEWAHELYCAGHLIEAGIAHHRATGKTSLLDLARRFADHIDSIFGPGKREGACGHPEIELALVELYRETGEARYLNLASFFIDQRGRGRVSGLRHVGPGYMQERVPLREAVVVEGHAVRQLYLNAGATDLYLETGEQAWLEVMRRLWRDMTAHRMYLTGGFGSRSYGEAFGEAYELPSREAYCETCAAIAAMMWNWRMLLATGEARFADVLERSLYNGFLSGVALDGRRFFYENPLQSAGGHERQEWFACACCPPNVMRQIALVSHYLATTDATGAQIHQYASARIDASPFAVLRLETNYPWEGQVNVVVEAAEGRSWRLALRAPGWCEGAALTVNSQVTSSRAGAGSYAVIEREWKPGDVVALDLPMPARLTTPHPQIDALRGSLAIERGPLVYCLEEIDLAPGLNLAAVRVSPASALRPTWRGDLLGGVMAIEAEGALADLTGWAEHLYRPAAEAATPHRAATFTAAPYYAWANRGPGKMRVWLPVG